jgi:DNA-binding transcriptional MerR regulator
MNRVELARVLCVDEGTVRYWEREMPGIFASRSSGPGRPVEFGDDAVVTAFLIKNLTSRGWSLAAVRDALGTQRAEVAQGGTVGNGQSETLREIFRLRADVQKQAKDAGKRVPSDIDADIIVFADRPDLYAAYLRENTRGGQ